ncbi:MAG: HAD-IA family hydrolase [Candidatus Aminicenantes bacterium]|nr:HAD-IA family hydrolase [Candidatus Aminicenantes bacterium]
MKLKCVIFDMDGTVVDVTYDWGQIRAELDTQGKSILFYLNSLEEPDKSKKWKVLERYERQATEKARLKPGMGRFLDLLNKKGIKKALVTNNSQKNVSFLLEKFNLEFDCVIARESGLWKPSGAPFQAVLKELGLKKEECCVVGDSHFDVRAAEEAGIPNVFILNEDKERFASMPAEVFSSAEALQKRIENLLEKEK